MIKRKYFLILLVNFASIFKVSLLETIHFTNSAHKILRANNYTTYKVDRPEGGDPITIIEANTPLINKNIRFNEVENSKYPIKQNHDVRNNVMDLKTSLSMTVTPHNNNDEYENPPGEEESVTRDYGSLSPEHNHHRQQSMKTVYSPELLEKFLKDYANKVSTTTAANEPEHLMFNQGGFGGQGGFGVNENQGGFGGQGNFGASENQGSFGDNHQHFGDDSGKLQNPLLNPMRFANKLNQQRPFRHPDPVEHDEQPPKTQEVTNDKYESIEAEGDDNQDEADRRVSNGDQDAAATNDVQERKHFRPSNYQHPYNKNSGWVTLEAVPWSKSKVSKWQSSVKPQNSYSSNNNNNNYNYQSSGSGGSGYNRPPSRPPSYNYDDDYNNNNDNEDYYAQRPSRPSYQNNQFYGGGNSGNRPEYSHHSSSSSHHSSNSYNSHDDNNNNYRPNRPEIITDNRPSNFPSHPDSHSQNHNNDHRPYEYSHNRPNHDRPNGYDRPSSYQYSGGNQNYHHYSNKDGSHPLTYPNSGAEGDWVLVSTTKGYQFPKRNGQRAMMFQAQNGVEGSDKGNSVISSASNKYEQALPLRPLSNVGPTKTTQQQIKLTVLPMYANENGARPYGNNNNMDVGVYKPASYNGIIETEPSTQTIEESVAHAAHANESNSISSTPHKTVKRKRKHMKNYLMRKNAGGNDPTAMIAAVGAGLLPASIGLIAPMVLG